MPGAPNYALHTSATSRTPGQILLSQRRRASAGRSIALREKPHAPRRSSQQKEYDTSHPLRSHTPRHFTAQCVSEIEGRQSAMSFAPVSEKEPRETRVLSHVFVPCSNSFSFNSLTFNANPENPLLFQNPANPLPFQMVHYMISEPKTLDNLLMCMYADMIHADMCFFCR